MVTDDPTATATFTFTGTGIAFSSPLWADSITAAVALDGGAPETIDLSDPTQIVQDGGPSTQSSTVRWQRLDLPNSQHTLVVSVPVGGTYAVVDMLIYYTDDTTTTSSSSSSSSSTSSDETSTSTTTTRRTGATNAANAAATSSNNKGMAIALGVVLGVAGLLALLGLIYWLRRRAQRRAEHEAWLKANQEPPQPPQPPMEEVNDGITAGKGKRFKSVPSRKNLLDATSSDFGSYDTEQAIAAYRSRHSHIPSTGSNGRASGLRNVVTSEQPALPDERHRHTRTPSDLQSQTSTSPDQRKFTLSPHSEPNSSAPSFRT